MTKKNYTTETTKDVLLGIFFLALTGLAVWLFAESLERNDTWTIIGSAFGSICCVLAFVGNMMDLVNDFASLIAQKVKTVEE